MTWICLYAFLVVSIEGGHTKTLVSYSGGWLEVCLGK